jgi:hypothetical protein
MQTRPTAMTTLTDVLERLRQKHRDNEFTISNDGFTTNNGQMYKPEDLTIIKTYRFEGESDPADSSIVYLIEAKDGTIGYSIDAYGVYSTHEEENYDDLIKKIPVQERDEQVIFE